MRALAWFDRVESKSNPVDGLSRGVMKGPWADVVEAKIPSGLMQKIKDELERRGINLSS